MPVRKIPKNYRNVTGVAGSATKAVGAAQFESTLERDFLRLLECSPEVEHFEVQPLTLRWREGSVEKKYTPDVLVFFHEATGRKPWLCEVKYRADLKANWPELHPKFLRAIKHARQYDWRFRIRTELEIRGPALTNARFLQSYRSRTIPEGQSSRILALITSLKATTPSELLEAVAPNPSVQAEWLPAIWHLVSRCQIGVDLESPLTMSSQLWSLE